MIANSAHIPAYRQFSDDFEIVAVSDINPAAVQDTAKRHGIDRFYTDASEMLEKEKPDVVSVCVPNCFHKEYTLMACQSMRFTPDRLAAKKFIDDGNMDKIYYGELARVRRRGIPTWGTFHIKKISCGGAFVDIGVHMLDALVWLMGNPKISSVHGVTMQNHKTEIGSLTQSGALTGEVHNQRKFDPNEMDVEDFSCGMLNFENGARVNFKVAWATNMPEASDIRLVSRKAGVDLPSGIIYSGEDKQDTLKIEKCPYDTPFFGHMYLADNLRKVLKGEAEPIVTEAETKNVAAILELFYKSAESGREEYIK